MFSDRHRSSELHKEKKVKQILNRLEISIEPHLTILGLGHVLKWVS